MNHPQENPVFRFAPSPNGYLHLGHAYSALLNFDMAQELGGQFLLRIEDIDITRCNPALEMEGLIYPAFMSRSERNRVIAEQTGLDKSWPCDPDGAPHYPDYDRGLSLDERQERIEAGEPYAFRRG